jgi:hypothetical protein
MLRFALTALVAGLALGLFSVVGDRLPADTLHLVVALANAAGPWFVVAFAVGSLQVDRKRGAVAAALALAIAVVVYYAGIYVGGNEVADLARVAGAWLVIAAVVGPVLGAAGAAWSGGDARSRGLAVSLLGGLLLAEAAHRLIQVEAWTGLDLTRSDIQVGLVEVASALLVPLLLLRAEDRRRYLVSVPIAMAGVLAIFAVTAAIRAALSA